jgi:hypothetical protein
LSNDGESGIAIGRNRIEAIDTEANRNIELRAKGTGKVKVESDLSVNSILEFPETYGTKINFNGASLNIGVQNSGTLYFRTSSMFAWYQGGIHNDDWPHAGGGDLRMLINPDGNVAIGRQNPLARLHVDGDMRAEGTIYAENFETNSGGALGGGGGGLFEGMIVMWSGKGNQIPQGWVLCDGDNGTPNLIDQFIIGSEVYDGEQDGYQHDGTEDFLLKRVNLPRHTHEMRDILRNIERGVQPLYVTTQKYESSIIASYVQHEIYGIQVYHFARALESAGAQVSIARGVKENREERHDFLAEIGDIAMTEQLANIFKVPDRDIERVEEEAETLTKHESIKWKPPHYKLAFLMYKPD